MTLERFADSVLVVAHPDDEALWFSSILRRVTRIVITYEDCDDLPALGDARRKASGEYPLANVTFLRRPEPCSLAWADWREPESTPYGMRLNRPGAGPALDRYRSAFDALRIELRAALAGAERVFTHNPWGEYGHPDHVQVSSVVRSLAAELGFRACFSSYVAPRSAPFAAEFLPRLRAELVLPTDRALFAELKGVYARHGAWTWHAAYEPPASEAFLGFAEATPSEAQTLPLTCLMTT